MRAGLSLLVAMTAALGSAARAGPPPTPRVASLNPCLDAILLEVADPGQIAALSRYSQTPSQSAVWAKARRFPFTDGSAEAIVALKPDLVLIGGGGPIGLTAVLPRLHIKAASFGVPAFVDESLAQVTRVAALVGHPERGVALNARIRAALRAAAPPPGEAPLRALVYEYHGMASGPGTLMDELLRRTGFENAAARYGLRRTADVPLERLLVDPPQVLLSGGLAPNAPTWADRVLSHPALRALAPRVRQERFPETLLFCGGPVIIPAVETLARARADAERSLAR